VVSRVAKIMPQKNEEFVVWDRSYCSDDVASRAIEPLSSEDQTRVSSLKQVQVIHRHGARTVASVDNCFGDYHVEMDCSQFNEVIGSSISSGDDHGTTKIVYDLGGNAYSGTCNTGQLLKVGAEQEIQNGKNLKAAYVGVNPKINLWENAPDITSNQKFLYSTDLMRTRQSILHTLKGFFGYNSDMNVEVHSRDGHNDSWTLGHALCPFEKFEYSEDDINWLAAQDEEYTEFESKWKETFGVDFGQECWDHMASALCANWALPPPLQNQSSSFFKDAINFGFDRAKTGLCSNQSILFVKDIMQDIKSRWLSYQELGFPSLVIWSAHDTSIGAWLHAFGAWDYVYPPFASIITIEIYEMAETESFDNGFRVTYQGKPITRNITGCASGSDSCDTGSDICDIDTLLDKYPSGTDWTSYCAQEVPTTNEKLIDLDFALGAMVGVACCAGIFITLLVISKFRKKTRPEYKALN